MKRSVSDSRKPSEELSATRRQRSVKWDEANLEENEKIQIELNPRKINEPKTPYHGPLDSDDDLGGTSMAPLSLEDEASVRQLAEERSHHASTLSPKDEERASTPHGYSDSERSSREYSGAMSTSYNSQSSGGQTNPGDECMSKPADQEKQREKRKKFEDRRRRHYNMREALRRGKELLSDEDERREGVNTVQQNGWQNHHH